MTPQERAKHIISDLLVNHLPRVQEGLEKGYVDENQILVIYDHAVRARVLTECAPSVLVESKSSSASGVSSPNLSILIRGHQQAWHKLAVMLGIKCWPIQEPRFVSEKVQAMLSASVEHVEQEKEKTLEEKEA